MTSGGATMGSVREKFSSQADVKLLAEMRKIARSEGRQLQALLDEALRDYVEKKHSGKARPNVRKAFAESLRDFDALYKELAK
jgi:hypothetical protein